MKSLLIAALAACVAVPAVAEDWTNAKVISDTVNPTEGAPKKVPLANTDYVQVTCGRPSSWSGQYPQNLPTTCATEPGVTSRVAYVAISEFARADSVATLADRVSALESGSMSWLQTQELARGIAMSSSFNLSGPTNGNANRIAFGLGTFEGENAFSLNYSRQAGDLDIGVATAFSNGDTLAKIGLGFSW